MNYPVSIKIMDSLKDTGLIVDTLEGGENEDWLYVKDSETANGLLIIIKSNSLIRFMKRITYEKPRNFDAEYKGFADSINKINFSSYITKWTYQISDNKIEVFVDKTSGFFSIEILKADLKRFKHEVETFKN